MRRQHVEVARPSHVGDDLTFADRQLTRHEGDGVVRYTEQDQLWRVEKIKFVVVHELHLVTDATKGEGERRAGTSRPDDGNVHFCSYPFQPLAGAVRC